MGNQNQILDAPGGQFVMEEKIIRRSVTPDRIHHRFIRAVGDGIANGCFLAFELIPETAIRAGKIAGFRVVAQTLKR